MAWAFGDHRADRNNCGHRAILGIATDGRELLGDLLVRRRHRPQPHRPRNSCSTAGRQEFRLFGYEHGHRHCIEQDLSNDLHIGTATDCNDSIDSNTLRSNGIEYTDCHRHGITHRVADELVERATPQCCAAADEWSRNRDAAQQRQFVFGDSNVVDELSAGLDRQRFGCPEHGDQVIAQEAIAGVATQLVGTRRCEHPAAVDIHHGHRRAGRTHIHQGDAALPCQHTCLPERTQLGTEFRHEHDAVREILIEGRCGVALAQREHRIELLRRMHRRQSVHRGDDGVPGIGSKTVGRGP